MQNKLVTNDDRQRFIYFPSLSSGNSRYWLLRDRHFENGTHNCTSRFYHKDYPEKFQHPAFLISAGHCPTAKKTFAEEMGLQDALVMGDSGGHQIATGAVPWDALKKKRDEIFEWLEETSDISMNLDIPPRVTYENRFQEALEISLENFRYFADKQTGKTDFVNILQVRSEGETAAWYNAVKGLPFKGWGIGSAGSIRKIMYTVALLLENGEFDKKDNQWFHYLGVTNVSYLFLLSMLQRQFNQRYHGRVKFSTDSSSPNRATIFGQYYFNVEWKKMAYMAMTFPKNGVEYDKSMPLPCELDCPACAGRTFEAVAGFDEYSYMTMTNHNMHIFQWIIENVNKIVDCPTEVMNTILPSDFIKLYNSIGEMLESDKPLNIYAKYTHLYDKLSSTYNITGDNTVMEKFFKFD